MSPDQPYSEAVERGARELYATFGGGRWELEPEHERERWREKAHAVLTAAGANELQEIRAINMEPGRRTELEAENERLKQQLGFQHELTQENNQLATELADARHEANQLEAGGRELDLEAEVGLLRRRVRTLEGLESSPRDAE